MRLLRHDSLLRLFSFGFSHDTFCSMLRPPFWTHQPGGFHQISTSTKIVFSEDGCTIIGIDAAASTRGICFQGIHQGCFVFSRECILFVSIYYQQGRKMSFPLRFSSAGGRTVVRSGLSKALLSGSEGDRYQDGYQDGLSLMYLIHIQGLFTTQERPHLQRASASLRVLLRGIWRFRQPCMDQGLSLAGAPSPLENSASLKVLLRGIYRV
ncbi:hypothetical protein GE09DRAFT_414687 [Coniochaeta sp. 2T2.1]|nr:hypothetical protein GE09DRAFT_414687 [Coniochaeta sp. 2T2.1]